MKGWTVRTESTKGGSGGVADREIYLSDKEHINHVNTERIGCIWGDNNRMRNIAYNGERHSSKLKAAGKGGRPPASYSVEFTLNLPKGYRPTDAEWELIVVDMINKVARKLKVAPQELANQTYAVLHQQKQDPDPCPRTGREQGTGDHLHVVMGKFTPGGLSLRDLQRKTVTNLVKDTFNESTLKHCGYDWTEYRDHKLKAQDHANKRTVSGWKVKAARQIEIIKAQQEALDERSNLLIEKAKQLESVQDVIDDTFNDMIALKRLMGNFSRQSEKCIESLKEHDVKQAKRQANRICRTVDELGAFNVSDEDQLWMDKMTKAINEHEGIETQRIPAISEVRAKHRMKP